MNSKKLKEDLSNCLINFDRPVLITELLDDYQLSYDEVNSILKNYLVQQENTIKFEKKYLVHGRHEDKQEKIIYKIIEEPLLSTWLTKLINAESSLYSVEVAGGAKCAAPTFKPMRIVECKKALKRQTTETSDEAKLSTISDKKLDVKQEKNANTIKESLKELKKAVEVKEGSSETLCPEKKINDKKTAVKKGINNFFASSTAASKKTEDKTSKKPTTPKKMQDFFKKQVGNPIKEEKRENPAANTSVQLFSEEEDEPEVASSDEEEKLEALKRDIISSDVEIEQENNCETTSSTKRRRILDSDDDDTDPPAKQEKLGDKEDIKEEELVAETYLDEEGFVITKKPKQKPRKLPSSDTTQTKKVLPVTIKTSLKETKKSNLSLSKDTKASKNPAGKTKQAGIMNFFSKK